jgi:hypothetical protein
MLDKGALKNTCRVSRFLDDEFLALSRGFDLVPQAELVDNAPGTALALSCPRILLQPLYEVGVVP